MRHLSKNDVDVDEGFLSNRIDEEVANDNNRNRSKIVEFIWKRSR